MRTALTLAVALLLGATATARTSAQPFDQYGGYTGLKGTNTSGFFRVEKIDGRYWLVTPENNVFWSVGLSGVLYYDSWGAYNPHIGYRPNACSIKAKYEGGQAEWTAQTYSRLREWGFNTVAAWSLSSIPDTPENVRILGLAAAAINQGVRNVAGFPDVFDPVWDTVCDSRCKGLASIKNNPWTIGICPDNELYWSVRSYYGTTANPTLS